MSTAPSPARKREATSPAMHISPSQPTSPPQRRRYTCNQCERSFTTGGHLARHARVHTGERNHKCPFPGCETKCSRQDNLQQHYRIHLSPGSRRTSGAATRAAMTRQANMTKTDVGHHGRARSRSSSNTPSVGLGTPSESRLSPIPEPPNTPPPLEHAYPVAGSVSGHSSTRSPTPELVPATPYVAVHSNRVTQSPELAYAASSMQSAAHWSQHDQRYAYSDRDQPPSPASSQDSHYGSANVPVSPNAQYSYNHYQQGSSSGHLGKYEQSSPPIRRSSLPTLAQATHVQAQSSQIDQGAPHASTSYSAGGYSQPYMSGMSNGMSHSTTGSSGSFSSVAVYEPSQGTHHDVTHSPQAHYSPVGANEPAYSYSHSSQAYPHASTSHARSSSPPVTLAPIQTDRLVRGGESLPTPLPTLSSTTSLASPAHYHSAHHHQHSMAGAARTSSAAQLHVATQQQQQYSSVQHGSPSPHDGTVTYPPFYSSLSQSNASWRPEAFRRSSLAV